MIEQRFVSRDDGTKTPATRRREGRSCKEKMEQGSLSREDGIRTPSYEKMEQDSSVTRWNKDVGHEKREQENSSHEKMEHDSFVTKRWIRGAFFDKVEQRTFPRKNETRDPLLRDNGTRGPFHEKLNKEALIVLKFREEWGPVGRWTNDCSCSSVLLIGQLPFGSEQRFTIQTAFIQLTPYFPKAPKGFSGEQ